MKPPDHPSPSGDREIARLTLQTLEMAGFAPRTVSTLRTLDIKGDTDLQAGLTAQATREVQRLQDEMTGNPPALWFTYHCHYKAPDLIGPAVCDAFGLPYVISEPSISRRRREGPWTDFAARSEAAITAADQLFWTTRRDEPALAEAGHHAKMTHLPAFVDPGPEPCAPPQEKWLRLLTVAMMRPGDKLESYRRLAEALPHLDDPWRLDIIGDGPARAEVETAMAPVSQNVTFHGSTGDRDALRHAYQSADAFVWPGVGEGVGMVYLEAQAAGLPVVAESHLAQRDLIDTPLAPPGQPRAFANLISQTARNADLRGHARRHILKHHSLTAAAALLQGVLAPLCQ
jgi:glycosyltransferase involved in cell wall biosynthesis